ncbi:SdrD B-like domain-containing protein [Runella sp. SP2]|uniref:SdrD B-like domain-containing protein n=1 Tax=Runella sp. SP2 TaxID=2268026 RepID=UPI000F07801D|nr:SdrD B-like domain-containing protein [Runella sp. SP2]AYQ35785.1 DUF11 domain-containing protein [Runella sp. SP2]
MKSFTIPFICKTVGFMLFFGFWVNIAHSQVTLSLDYKAKAGTPDTVLSGQFWTMQLDYSISSTTAPNVSGVKIEVAVPDFINSMEGLSGTTQAPLANFSFNNTPGAKKLTITFVNPVPTGSTGVLEFRMRSTNGATPNNTTIESCATLTDAAANTSGTKCHEMVIKAVANLCGSKTLKGGGAVGVPTTYRIGLTYGTSNIFEVFLGSLNVSNILVSDTLPTGATYVSAKVVDGFGSTVPSTITQTGNVVTTTFPDYVINNINNSANIKFLEITVKFDSPTFNVGDIVTNKASITFTPLGGNPVTLINGSTNSVCTSDLIETTTLVAAVTNATLFKSRVGASTVNSGADVAYDFGFANTGNVPLENVEIIDTIPAHLTYSAMRMDAYGSAITALQYQTNLNSTWTNWVVTNAQNTPPPPLAAGERLTAIKFILANPFEANATITGTNLMVFTTDIVTTPTIVTNCIDWTSTTANLPANRRACAASYTINPPSPTAKANYSSSHSPGCATYSLNQEITFTGSLTAEVGYANLENPVVAFYTLDGAKYVPNSEVFNASTSGITTPPTLTVMPGHATFSGQSYTLYRWTFPTGTVLPTQKSFLVSVKVKLTNALPGGSGVNVWFVADGSNVSDYAPFNSGVVSFTDKKDWNLDNDTTQVFNVAPTSFSSCPLVVTSVAEMESIKWVKGLCDTTYSRFPAFGQTVPGGNADYRLIVKNKGNVVMKDIKIVDILPFIGDRGVIDPQTRNSAWRPNLADPIVAPSGITVYYTTVGNPCRDEVKQPSAPSPFPTGCVPPNWTTTPPSDITKVQAVKIDFGTKQLAGGDSLVFNWPMRAPVNSPTNDEIAWNSFGFVATRTDNNQALLAAEPPKVGIKVKPGSPAFYGDRVWFDTNKNGIQDAGEGGVDGIKVKLFSPKVAGSQTPATDSLINFTITGNGGLYKFSNLPPGDYYAVFCLPTGYSISPKNAAGSTLDNDSDGTQTTYDGGLATIVATTNLVADEEDYSWDQGIFCDFTPAVTGVQSVSLNSSVTLTASGGTTYLWSGPNGFSATTAAITINPVTPADTGTYVVNIEVGACRASLTTGIKIAVCTKPLALATPKVQTICVGGAATAFTVTPSTDVEYKWYGPLADTTSSLGTAVSGATSATFIPSGAALTTAGTKYYAVVVNTTGDVNCADTAYVQLIVNAKPVIADGSATICAGESVDLTSKITNYSTYLSPVWTIGTANGTAVATPTSVKPTGTTTYVLVAQNAAGCKDTANVVVTVNAKPNAGKDTTLACVNATNNTLATSYTLVPSPTEGTWSQLGTTPATATISGNNVTGMTVTGTYQFIYTTAVGCKDTVAVTVAPCAGCVKPNAGADAANVCQPTSTAKLTAVTTGGTWAPIGSPANPSAATIDANGNISGLNAAGTYKFVYSVTSGGQTCTDTAQVIVLAKPVIADGSATICAGESVDLTSKITNYDTYLSPVWTVGTANGTVVATPSSVKPIGTTTYVLVAQNAAGCKDTANVVVTVNVKLNAGKDTTLACVNAATNTLATSYTLVPNPAGGSWTQLGTTPTTATISGNNVTGMSVAGTYQFIYTTTAGCKDTVAVTVAPCAGCVKPNAGADAANVCQPTSTAKLTAVTTGGTWAPIGSPANPSAATIDANGNISGLNAAGTYKFVYSVTSGGQTCTDTAQVTVLAKPVIADGSATICAGESVDLTSKITNYNTYLSPVWTIGTANGTAVATPNSVKPTGTTTYVLVAQNAAGCKDTANVVVTVNVKPSAGKDTTLACVNAATNTLATSYTLVPSPAGGSWSQLGTTPTTAAISGNNVTGMSVAGTYQFIYTTTAGCKDTVAVTVAPCAGCVKPNAGPDAANVCQPTSTAKLTAVTAGGTWAPIGSPANPSAATIDANGNISGLNAAGTYKFVYSVMSGGQTCTDTAQVVVLAKPVIADGSTTICAGELVDLTSKITNYDTYLSPVWTVGTANGPVVAAPKTVKPTGTTTYVLVAQNAAGCKDTANVVVTVNAKPSAGKDTTLVCSNGNVPSSVQLSATPTGGTWSALTGNPTGATVSSSGLVSITNATAQGKSFNFVYSVNGCQDTVKVIVPTCPAPCVESTISSAAPVCSNDAQTYSFTFTINNQLGIVKVNKGTLTGTNPYTVSGIPSGQSVIITDSLSAICKADTTIAGVNCNCNPALPQLLTPSLTACIGDTFPTLKATVVGLATVEWFSQQTGGTALFTGLNYKPSGTVSANTVFYAQARSTDPTCPTAISTSRVPATINAQTCIDTIDLALKKSINTKIARVGDVLTYTIKVWNEWTKNATGVEVTDSIATTVQFVSGSFVASRGSATISGNVIKWNIGNIAAAGDTVTLRYQVRATQAGIHLNTAEISKTNEKDRDSTPGNGKGGEDDIDQECFTVPFELCAGQKLEVSVPANLTNVQWFKNGGTTAVATGNAVLFSEVGVYTFTATNQACPANGCCPVIIEAGTNCCPVDLCIPFTVKKVKK